MTICQIDIRHARTLVALSGALCWLLASGSARAQCVGDCDASGTVAIDELILGVNMSLGGVAVAQCPAFVCENDGTVPINCLVQGVASALTGCSGCPLVAGSYTLRQEVAGTLRIATFTPFPFPPGGTTTYDVGAGRMPACVHSVVVPFPGGFAAPAFCIPGLGLSVKLEQAGCGIGQIDSNGGSDYTVAEVGDTSDASDTCGLPQTCIVGEDSALRVDVTIGDGIPDTCASGTANVIVAVPVLTTTWVEHSSGDSCPPNDGSFDPDQGDQFLVEFPQVLDFTTDTNAAVWTDLDGDGCTITGAGPEIGLSNTGTCLDLESKTLVTAASGPIGSAVSVADITYSTALPNLFSGPQEALGATCDSPPAINFNGLAHRCIDPAE